MGIIKLPQWTRRFLMSRCGVSIPIAQFPSPGRCAASHSTDGNYKSLVIRRALGDPSSKVRMTALIKCRQNLIKRSSGVHRAPLPGGRLSDVSTGRCLASLDASCLQWAPIQGGIGARLAKTTLHLLKHSSPADADLVWQCCPSTRSAVSATVIVTGIWHRLSCWKPLEIAIVLQLEMGSMRRRK